MTTWNAGIAQRILVDAGEAHHYPVVKRFLDGLGVRVLDHIVVSHLHDDHAGGILELLRARELAVRKIWLHDPSAHADTTAIRKTLDAAVSLSINKRNAEFIQLSLNTIEEIWKLVRRMGIPSEEPFSGRMVGELVVLGPTKEYYQANLRKFTSLATFTPLQKALSDASLLDRVAAVAKQPGPIEGEPRTSPENNTSTVLACSWSDEGLVMLTADAGVEALDEANSRFGSHTRDTAFFQIPHHGSRHNINRRLIEHFRAKTAHVSAAGNTDHPNPNVVREFKRFGSVYSTHHPPPGSSKRWQRGSAPPRPGQVPAIPL